MISAATAGSLAFLPMRPCIAREMSTTYSTRFVDGSGRILAISAPAKVAITVQPTMTGISFGGSLYQGVFSSATEPPERVQCRRAAGRQPALGATARVRQCRPQL